MRANTLLKRYMWTSFMFVTLLPIAILSVSAGIFPSSEGGTEEVQRYEQAAYYIGLIVALFVITSWLFFYRIRRRLLSLQQAMTSQSDSGIPAPVAIEKRDEIGRLSESFNRMIEQLEGSRRREGEEEALRRQLIANLSHDLRTPLTAMRGHASRLAKESLSEHGQESLQLLDDRITHMGKLIDDLLAYTLITSGKYPYRPVRVDVVRLVRASIAAWYPAFESKGFRVEAELPEEATFYWEADQQWLERIMDNYYQNIIRHASSGAYIGIHVDVERETIRIDDHGPGMDEPTMEKGAGIGLAIIERMLGTMKLQATTETSRQGTSVRIVPSASKN